MAISNDDLAADYVLGLLEPDGLAEAEARAKRDPVFALLVEQWRQRLSPLDQLVLPMEPPANLFDRIMADVESQSGSENGSVTHRKDDGTWVAIAPGVERKELWRDNTIGRRTVLVRLAPRAEFQGHHHTADEQCYVLEGQIQFGSLALSKGDFHVAPAGSSHPSATTDKGCLLLIHSAV